MAGSILALDLATKTGWAVGSPGAAPRCGSIRLAPADASNGAVYVGLARWLGDFLAVERPRSIMIEAPLNARTQVAVGTTEATALRLFGLVAIAEMVAHARGVWDVRTASVQDVRQHFVGARRFKAKDEGKRVVAEQCRVLGWQVPDLDAADAAALWDFGCAIIAPREHARGVSALSGFAKGKAA